MINYLTLCQGSKVIREEHNTGLKPYPCHMPLLHKNLAVIVYWLTFTQPQLIGWLADWLEADLLTDLLYWLLCLPTYWPIDWLNGWLTGNNTSLVTNHWNKTRFSWIFWKILYIHSSHVCSHSNIPLSSPNVEPHIFWSTETTVIPKSTLGKGKITQVFQDLWRVL